MRLLLVGGSSGNHVLAADIGRKAGYQVSILTRKPNLWSTTVSAREKLVLTSWFPFIGPEKWIDYTGELHRIYGWDESTEAIDWADAIILCTPVNAYRSILKHLVPLIPKDSSKILGVLYGQGGFDWTLRDELAKQAVLPTLEIFALKRFPYLCKKEVYGHSVRLMGRFPRIVVAIEASEKGTVTIKKLLIDLFGKQLIELPSFISCNLTLSNQVLHPAINWGHFSDFDPQNPYECPKLFYGDCNPLAAKALDAVADEIRQLAKSCESLTDIPILKTLGSDPPMIWSLWLRDKFWPLLSRYEFLVSFQNSIVAFVIRSNKRLNGAVAPMIKTSNEKYIPDFKSRFWGDDIPYGLCVVYGIAEILGVKMEATKNLIFEQQKWLEKEYVTAADGIMRLDGSDVGETNAPQRYGVTNKESLKIFLTSPILNTREG